MLQAHGTVVERRRHQVLVESPMRSACNQCAATDCGVGTVAKALPGRRQRLWVDCEQPLSPGQAVVLGVPEQGLVGAALYLYLVPLLGLVLGALVMRLLGLTHDIAMLGGAMVGALAGWLLSRAALRGRGAGGVCILEIGPAPDIPIKCLDQGH